jgi:hypothetical protein
MFGWLRKAATPEEFWGWLVANSGRIKGELQEKPRRIADQVGRAFDRSFKGLSWEVEPAGESPWTFIVSADGNTELFDRVREACRSAPESMDGWTVQAFRPRRDIEDTMEFEGRKLTMEDIWWSAKPDGGGAHLNLWVRGLTPTDLRMASAVLIFLDATVGEYDAATKVLDIVWGDLPEEPARAGKMSPLKELPAFLDRLPGPDA